MAASLFALRAGLIGEGASMTREDSKRGGEGACCSISVSSGEADLTRALSRAGRAISSFLTMSIVDLSRADLSAIRSTLASGVRDLMRLLESPSGCEA